MDTVTNDTQNIGENTYQQLTVPQPDGEVFQDYGQQKSPIAQDIQAPNYVPGTRGWKLGADGSVDITTELHSNTDAATITFDIGAYAKHTVTLGGNRTLALTNVGVGKVFIIRLKQDATGSRTVTWFSTLHWPGGSAPTLTTTASHWDVFAFMCTATGVYDGYIIGQDLS